MEREGGEILPQIVIIIDELADLMMVAPTMLRTASADWPNGKGCRHASCACNTKAVRQCHNRSYKSKYTFQNIFCGIIPGRSRTILDMAGAEKLLGKGICCFILLVCRSL